MDVQILWMMSGMNRLEDQEEKVRHQAQKMQVLMRI